MSDDDPAGLRVVGGHMGFGIHRLLPGPSAYLAFLRDPVDRIVSHYHYTRRHPEPRGTPGPSRLASLDAYVRSLVFAPIVNNGQTRMLGSDVRAARRAGRRGDPAAARAAIDRYDLLLGLQVRFDESLLAAGGPSGGASPPTGART